MGNLSAHIEWIWELNTRKKSLAPWNWPKNFQIPDGGWNPRQCLFVNFIVVSITAQKCFFFSINWSLIYGHSSIQKTPKSFTLADNIEFRLIFRGNIQQRQISRRLPHCYISANFAATGRSQSKHGWTNYYWKW